jgi:hypothetical protein
MVLSPATAKTHVSRAMIKPHMAMIAKSIFIRKDLCSYRCKKLSQRNKSSRRRREGGAKAARRRREGGAKAAKARDTHPAKAVY